MNPFPPLSIKKKLFGICFTDFYMYSRKKICKKFRFVSSHILRNFYLFTTVCHCRCPLLAPVSCCGLSWSFHYSCVFNLFSSTAIRRTKTTKVSQEYGMILSKYPFYWRLSYQEFSLNLTTFQHQKMGLHGP